MIYLDHNATTPVDQRVFDAMVPYLRQCFGNPASFYQLGRDARAAVALAREKVAAGLGALPGQIVFTAGGTESDNLAIRGVAHAMRRKGSHLITSAIEHQAVLKTCEDLAHKGYAVTFLPVDRQGVFDPDEVRRAIRPDTILITNRASGREPRTWPPPLGWARPWRSPSARWSRRRPTSARSAPAWKAWCRRGSRTCGFILWEPPGWPTPRT